MAIVGSVGVPAKYGGFETLVENLVRYHSESGTACDFIVYCSSPEYNDRVSVYFESQLVWVPLKANGAQSVLYDTYSIFSAIGRGCDEILILGVSGAIAIPVARLVSDVKITVNVDGIEWRRRKWRGFARAYLRLSEWLAVRSAHRVIADNPVIKDYLCRTYGRNSRVIPYGGDHALVPEADPGVSHSLPLEFAFSVCRIEPENNVHVILEAFCRVPDRYLVFVGNWSGSDYGRGLRCRYAGFKNIILLDPIYELAVLAYWRKNAWIYVHGHSAGGTNPSLVEAMHFGRPVVCFDCDFNRSTTRGAAFFFKDCASLVDIIKSPSLISDSRAGEEAAKVAREVYTWSEVCRAYFDVLSIEGKGLK